MLTSVDKSGRKSLIISKVTSFNVVQKTVANIILICTDKAYAFFNCYAIFFFSRRSLIWSSSVKYIRILLYMFYRRHIFNFLPLVKNGQWRTDIEYIMTNVEIETVR